MGRYARGWQALSAKAKREAVDPHCWLCGEPIDVELHHNHRMAFTLDHVITKLENGEDDLSNALYAHRGCNAKRENDRRARIRNGDLMRGVKQSREW